MIQQKVRSKNLRSGLRTSLMSGAISALISAFAGAAAYPELPLIESLIRGAAAGFGIGTLTPALLFLANFYAFDIESFRRLPFLGYMLATALIILAATMLAYFAVGVVFFPELLFDLQMVGFSLALSAFLSVTLSLANSVRQFAGPGVVWALISGRYHRAFHTEAVFVFVDMVASTAMAERLGSARFFQMINRFHRIVDGACLYHDGSLYKYLGDGAILVWPANHATQALDCLRTIIHELQERRDEFQKEFGEELRCTAGIHSGTVITGEIGDQRKEIGYWGDAVNTAARIQSACKEHSETALVSGELRALLPEREASALREIGAVSLRGKERSVLLFALQEDNK